MQYTFCDVDTSCLNIEYGLRKILCTYIKYIVILILLVFPLIFHDSAESPYWFQLWAFSPNSIFHSFIQDQCTKTACPFLITNQARGFAAVFQNNTYSGRLPGKASLFIAKFCAMMNALP